MVGKSKGRQKSKIEKITSETHKMVTFSKRRSGLFRKACELSTLCGAEVAVIVYSPGNKAYSFGHPSVENVAERFLSGNTQTSDAFERIEAHRNVTVCQLNMQLTQMNDQLEMEKKIGQELDRSRKFNQSQNWWENPIEELDMAQLEELKGALQELKQDVARQAEQTLIQNSNPNQPLITTNASPNGSFPFDAWRSGFKTNMTMTPANNNMAMAPINPNMTMPPVNTNLAMITPVSTNMTMPPVNTISAMAPYNTNMNMTVSNNITMAPVNTNMTVPPINTNIMMTPDNTKMTMTPLNTNIAMAPYGTSMTMTPLNTNTNLVPYNANISVSPYGYDLRYGNGNLGYGNGFF